MNLTHQLFRFIYIALRTGVFLAICSVFETPEQELHHLHARRVTRKPYLEYPPNKAYDTPNKSHVRFRARKTSPDYI